MHTVKKSGYLVYENQGCFSSEAYGEKTITVKSSSVDGVVNVL